MGERAVNQVTGTARKDAVWCSPPKRNVSNVVRRIQTKDLARVVSLETGPVQAASSWCLHPSRSVSNVALGSLEIAIEATAETGVEVAEGVVALAVAAVAAEKTIK